MKGIMKMACMKNLQAFLANLVARMFMIQPGIIALLLTVYSNISQERGLPEISSKKVPCPSEESLHIIRATLSS